MPTQQGPNTKLWIRMQNVARYRTSGKFTDVRVAEMAGLTPSGLASLIKNPDYIEIENALLEGRFSAMDEQIAHDSDAKKEAMRLAVPLALRAYIEVAGQSRDLKAKLAAARDILNFDPDRTFQDQKTQSRNEEDEAPTLPGDIIASISAEGNRVVAEIRTAKSSVNAVIKQTPKTESNKKDEPPKADATVTELPEAKGNA